MATRRRATAVCGLILLIAAGIAESHGREPGAATPPSSEPTQVFVPTGELEAVLKRDRSGVVLPTAEFRRLWETVRELERTQPKLPADTVVTSAQYTVELEGERAKISAQVQFRQFVDEWAVTSLPLRGLALESAQLAGAPARIARTPDNHDVLQLFHDQSGSWQLELELTAPIASVGSDKVVAFGLLQTPVAALSLAVPSGKQLLVNGLAVTTDPEQGTVAVPVGNRDEVSLRLTAERSEQSTDALVFANSAFGLVVQPGEVSWQATTELQVYGTPVDRLVFTVPKSLEIADVASNGLESWSLTESPDDDTRTQILLDYRQPFQDARRVTLRGVMSVELNEPWSVPGLFLGSATSHIGRLVVHYPRGTRLVPDEASGVRRAEAGQMSGYVGSSPELAESTQVFDIWQEDFELAFVTQTKQREVQANLSTIVEVSESGLDLDTVVSLGCLYAPLFQVDVTLPAEWTVLGVTVENQPVEWLAVPRAAGAHQLRIDLPKPLTPGARIRLGIQAHRDLEDWPNRSESAEFSLPEVAVPQSNVVDGTYLIKAADDVEVVPLTVEGLDPAFLNLPGERAGFRYQDSTFSATLRVSRPTARLAAHTTSYTRLDPDALRTHLEITLDLARGGERVISVSLPETVSRDLRFRILSGAGGPLMPTIVEQRSADPADGRLVWTLTFDRRLKQQAVLAVDLETPRERFEEAAVTVQDARILEADRQNGYVAIEGRPEQHLTIQADDGTGRPLPEADPADLPAPDLRSGYTSRERIVASYRYVTPGNIVTLTEDIFARVAVPTAVCEQLQLESVLGQTGQFQHRAVVQMKAVGVQALQVSLPPQAELWATLVDENPIEVHESTEGAFLVPLPTAGNVDQQRTVELYYETQLAGRLDHLGRVNQLPPALAVRTGSGELQPVEVLQRQWTVHYPETTLLVDSTGAFLPTTPLDQTSLLGAVQEELRVPTLRQLWFHLVVLAAATVGLTVLTLIYRRWRWRALVAAGLLLVLVGVIISFGMFWKLGADRAASELSMARSAARVAETAAVDFAAGGEEKADSGAAMPDLAVFESAAEFESAPEEDTPAPEAARPDTARPAPPTDDAALSAGLEAVDQPVAQNGPQAPPQNQAADLFDDVDFAQTDAQTDVAVTTERTRRGEARLSVRVELTKPESSSTQQFQYLGGLSGPDVPLEFVYENAEALTIVRLCIAFGVLLVFWLRRNASLTAKLVTGTLGLALPVALIAVLPVRIHLILDGLFLGALGGVALWIAFAACRTLSAAWQHLPRRFRRFVTAAAFLVLTMSGSSGLAQDPASDNDETTAVPEPTVVFPYDPAADPLAADKVFVPRKLFLELWNAAHPEDRVRRPAPEDAVVSGAVYAARLESDAAGQRVKVSGRVIIHSFRDKQIAVTIPLGNVALESALLDGAPAALHWRSVSTESVDAAETQPQQANAAAQQQAAAVPAAPVAPRRALTVAVTGAGRHLLDLEFYLPARTTGPEGEFVLPSRPVASGRLSFTLPAPDLRVQVNNTTAQYRLQRNEAEDVTTVEVPVDQGGDITVSWRPREQSGSMNTIVHADSSTALEVSDQGTRTTMGFRLSVKQGAVNSVAFRVPDDVKVQQIAGQDVGGWEFLTDGQRQLRVFFRREVDDATDLTFRLYRDHAITERGGSVSLPDFGPQGVTRDRGTIAVYASGHFEFRSINADGLRQINAQQFQPLWDLGLGSQTAQLAFRYAAPPFSLTLQIARKTAQAIVTAEHAMRVAPRKTFMTSRFVYDLKGTPRARLAYRLPLDFLTLNVQAVGLADWYIREERFDELLIVEFETPRSGLVEVVLEGFVRRLPGDEFVEIEATLPQDIDELQTTLAIGFDDLYSAALDEVVGWNPLEIEQLSDAIRQLLPRPQFAFRSTELEPLPMSFSLDRNTPRLDADVVNVITVFDTSVEYAINLKWQIRQAPAERFVFRGPDWLAGKLDIQASGVRQVEESSTEDGQVRWTVTLHQPIHDEFFALATATFPPAGTEPGAESVRLPAIAFETDDGENGFDELLGQRAFVLLVNRSLSQLVPSNADALQPVDGSALPIRVSAELIDSAMASAQIVNLEAPPTWDVRTLPQTTASPGSVNLADLVTVVAADGTWRTQAVYTTRNYRRQFLPVLLPAESRLLSGFVNNRPARPVQTTITVNDAERSVELLALPKASEADLAFPVKVVVAGRLDPDEFRSGLARLGQQLNVPVPRILSVTESPEFGMPVLQTRWKVHLPEEWHVTLGETNLSEKEAHAEVLDELTQIQEARELLSVLERNASARQNYKAWNNALVIDKRLGATKPSRYAKRKGLGLGSESEFELLARERDELRSKLEEYRSRIQVDSANQAVTIQDEDGAAARFDEDAQRKSVEEQNASLLGLNTIQSPGDLGGSLETFSFGLQLPGPGADGDKRNAGQAEPQSKPESRTREEAGKAMLGKQPQLKNRAENLRESISQLREQAQQGEQSQQAESALQPDGRPGVSPPVRGGFADQAGQAGAGAIGIGGGFGGPGFGPLIGQTVQPVPGEPPADDALVSPSADAMAAPWSAVGGLSLAFDIPTDGQVLTLTKVSGDPQLILQVRPQQSLKLGLGVLWALVWLVAAAAVVAAVRRGRGAAAVPAALTAVGLVAFFILPEPLSVGAFAVLLCGMLGIGVRYTRR